MLGQRRHGFATGVALVGTVDDPREKFHRRRAQAAEGAERGEG